MKWTAHTDAQLSIADLETSVGKAGASESVAIVAIIWGIVIIA